MPDSSSRDRVEVAVPDSPVDANPASPTDANPVVPASSNDANPVVPDSSNDASPVVPDSPTDANPTDPDVGTGVAMSAAGAGDDKEVGEPVEKVKRSADPQITRGDIEATLRRMRGEFDATLKSKAQQWIPLLVGAGVLIVVVAYLMGRRVGTTKSTVVEIRRI